MGLVCARERARVCVCVARRTSGVEFGARWVRGEQGDGGGGGGGEAAGGSGEISRTTYILSVIHLRDRNRHTWVPPPCRLLGRDDATPMGRAAEPGRQAGDDRVSDESSGQGHQHTRRRHA